MFLGGLCMLVCRTGSCGVMLWEFLRRGYVSCGMYVICFL